MNKLLIIAPQNPYPANDGGKIGIYYPVIHLSKYFEVHFAFITSHVVSPDVYQHFRQHNVSIYPQIKDTRDSAFGYISNVSSNLPFKFEKYCSATILERLDGICQSENISDVWCNHSHVAWYGLQLKNKRGSNIFLREHNIEYSLVHQVMQVQNNPLVRAFVKYQYKKTRSFEEKCWNEFSKTFFISDSDFSEANASVNKSKFRLLYDSVKEQNKIGSVAKEPFSFIFTANLDTFQNQYNLQRFIDEVWTMLIEKDNRWKLYITGNKPGVIAGKINSDLHHLNITDLGFVDDIQTTIASKAYFISPTYMGSGVRIKVLNALAGGAVCFVTDTDLKMLKTLVDGENIIKFDGFEDFYSKLLRLEADESSYNSISLLATQVGANFTWANYAETVYNEVTQTEGFTGR